MFSIRNNDSDLIDKYVKSFEVRKKIFSIYDKHWKPINDSKFDDYELYLLLADSCILKYEKTLCTKYLSCLLKVDDTLLSVVNKLNEGQKISLKRITDKEISFVRELGTKIKVEV